ncbi:TPA_asm: protein TrsE [Listeria monocytogenes]|nr:protein TrsE [Listeria monocytogenes]
MRNKKKQNDKTFQGFSLKDQLAPIIFREEEDYIKIGDDYERSILVINYPTERKIGWFREILEIDGNISISDHLLKTTSELAEQSISKSIKNINVKKGSSGLKANEIEKLELQKKQLQKALRRILQDETMGYFYVTKLIKIHAISLNELERLTARVKRKLSTVGISGYIANGVMKDSFLSHLPLLNNHIGRYTDRPMDSEAYATMFPFDSSELSVNAGYVVGINPKTNQLVNIDIRNLPNHNGCVFGESGYGKSVCMWENACRLYSDGSTRIIMIDPENEYGAAAKRLGGTVVNISNGTSDIINPLEVFFENVKNSEDKDSAQASDPFLEHLENKKVFFRLMYPGMPEIVNAEIDDCLNEVYKQFSIDEMTDFRKLKPTDYPILKDFYEIIATRAEESKDKELISFSKTLKQYVYGSNKKIFNGHTNVDLSNDFIVFNIKNLGSGSPMQVCAMHNTIQYIWNLITNDIRETYVFIDEMHVLNNPDTPAAMKLVYQIYKRIRKYGDSGVWASTQQTSDALLVTTGGMNYGAAVIENSRVKIFLPLSSRSIKVLKDEADMVFSEEELRILIPKENNKGQALMNYSGKKVHVKFIPTEKEWEILGKSPKN